MKRNPINPTDILLYLSIYPLLIFMVVFTAIACGLMPRLTDAAFEPNPPRSQRLVVVHPIPALPSPVSILVIDTNEPVSVGQASQIGSLAAVVSATPTADGALITNDVHSGDSLGNVHDFTVLRASILKPASLPVTLRPTASPPTSIQTPIASPTTSQSKNPTLTVIPSPTVVPSPTKIPSPTLIPVPDYDFMLAEYYHRSTTNHFLMFYVAIVDPNEIPIGDMKIVGTRLDNLMTYESPLSTWHYEGYNAPGEHVKSGNVKFEPPGGIESTSWVLHLEDAHGNRQSVDIPFTIDEEDKQWYFIKLRRKF